MSEPTSDVRNQIGPEKAGPDVVILSEAGKPIFSRWGNEEDLSTVCGIVQAIRATTVDDDSFGLGEIQSLRSGKLTIVFLTAGALTFIAIATLGPESDCETEAYLRLQLEYIYAQVIFTLTEQVHEVFKQSPGFDLRNMLGGTDSVMRGILDKAGALGNGGFFLTAGVETVCPLSADIREDLSQILQYVGEQTEHTLYAILLLGNKLVTLIQPSYRPHQLRSSDLHLITSFVVNQPGLLTTELWFPICLPRFNSSGFLHAYTSCLHRGTELNLILISQHKTTEQFNSFRNAAQMMKVELGLAPDTDESSVIKATDDEAQEHEDETLDGETKSESDDEAQSKNEGDENPNVNISPPRGSLESEQNKQEEESDFIKAIQEATNPNIQEALINDYCNLASALHFIFRCDVPVFGGGDSQQDRGMLTQSISPPLGFPFVDVPSKRRIWNMYQRLSLRLRLGSAADEATNDAFDMIKEDNDESASGDFSHIGKDCPAMCLMESPPNVHGVTYVLDGSELFVGLNGRDFELYAVLPGTIPPRNGTALCARLVRRLMQDETELFLDNPLTWDEH
eukprot:scaffold27876_cov51-Attheya_sp.AAC.3